MPELVRQTIPDTIARVAFMRFKHLCIYACKFSQGEFVAVADQQDGSPQGCTLWVTPQPQNLRAAWRWRLRWHPHMGAARHLLPHLLINPLQKDSQGVQWELLRPAGDPPSPSAEGGAETHPLRRLKLLPLGVPLTITANVGSLSFSWSAAGSALGMPGAVRGNSGTKMPDREHLFVYLFFFYLFISLCLRCFFFFAPQKYEYSLSLTNLVLWMRRLLATEQQDIECKELDRTYVSFMSVEVTRSSTDVVPTLRFHTD